MLAKRKQIIVAGNDRFTLRRDRTRNNCIVVRVSDHNGLDLVR